MELNGCGQCDIMFQNLSTVTVKIHRNNQSLWSRICLQKLWKSTDTISRYDPEFAYRNSENPQTQSFVMIQNLPIETLKIHRHNQSLWSTCHRLHHDVHFTRFTCRAYFTLQGTAGEELLQKQIYFWNEEKPDNWDWRFPLMLWKISSRDKTFPSTSI